MPVSPDQTVKIARQFTSGGAFLMRWIGLGCALWWMAGCTTEVAPPGSRFVVSKSSAAFYKNGPAESLDFAQHSFANDQSELQSGPDFRLPKGAHVTMLKREYGYSKVLTDDGVAGYVANEELQPAPVVARAAAMDMPTGRSYRERIKNNNNAPARKPDEQLDLNDLPLPLPG
jgi:hypothetical protein